MDMKDIHRYIDDRPAEGVFRVHRDVYSDPELFEMEMKYIFERTWSFLLHESLIPRPNDYFATHIGRVPVLVTRDAKGAVRAFLNACRHKGAKLTRTESGNRKYHVCSYHGWAYGADGRSVDVKDSKAGGYSDAFNADDHGLIPLGRLDSYKGLVFGSLSPDVPELAEFLGEIRQVIDLAMDQGQDGMEFIPGRIAYAYDANWKLQLDNGTDPYHLTSTHTSFLDIMSKRRSGEGNQQARQFDWQKRFSQEGGDFHFKNGHTAIWLNQPEVTKRPIYPAMESIRARVGEKRAEWMLKLRNMSVFPNMQIADSTSLLVRTFRPLSVGRTEMRYWCMGPKGEGAPERAWRLRQFEDFFNVSGMATPDDTITYESCQSGFAARELGWLQGYGRGIQAVRPGANAEARELGMEPLATVKGGFDLQSEAVFHPVYREWARMIEAGMSGKKAYE